MQNSIVKDFLPNPCVEPILFQQGNANGEEYPWAILYWTNHYLRYKVVFDADGTIGRVTFAQPLIGIPFGRHFVIDAQGNVASAFFGHNPLYAAQRIYETYGGDCDGDGLHDAWETGGFGDLSPDPGADPDGDGLSNREEYEAGTDPADPGSRPLIFLRKVAGEPWVGFEARPLEWWNAGRTRVHSVEGTGDVAAGGWTVLPGLERLTGEGWIEAYAPAAGPLRFYRLRVALE